MARSKHQQQRNRPSTATSTSTSKPSFSTFSSTQQNQNGRTTFSQDARPPPPAPFTLAPANLSPFLERLDPSHIYILSLDKHPAAFKRRLFTIPLLLNIFLSVVLFYRASHAIPYYFSLFITTLGVETEHKITVPLSDMGSLLEVIGGRTMIMAFDFFLFRFVAGWPWGFFLGALQIFGANRGLSSPVAWRRGVGFRPLEIVVRRSRRWDVDILGGETLHEDGNEGEGVIAADDIRTPSSTASTAAKSPEQGPSQRTQQQRRKTQFLERQGPEATTLWRDRIEPAVAEKWIREKTGYLMMDKSWDLDFGSMVQAHRLVDSETLTVDDFRTKVLVYGGKAYGSDSQTDEGNNNGWIVWDVWRAHDHDQFPISTTTTTNTIDNTTNSSNLNGQAALSTSPTTTSNLTADAKTTKIIHHVRRKLTDMGKEDLFFRWIEVLQHETSSAPAGQPFTVERRRKALRSLREEFDARGVDLDAFWDDEELGGVEEGMPGLEVTG